MRAGESSAQLLALHESRLVGGEGSGGEERLHSFTRLHQVGACLSSVAADSYGPDPHGRRGSCTGGGSGRPPFKALEELSVYATLCPPAPTPSRNGFDLKCSAVRARRGVGVMAGCQNSPSFSHYSHANKTSVGSFPGGLTLGLACASHGLRLKSSDGVGGCAGAGQKVMRMRKTRCHVGGEAAA